MYGSNRQFTEQYRKVGVQSSVTDADPHKLVALLLAGACERLRLALACLERGDQARKGKAIGEVCAIVGHLNGSLDHEAGGEIAGNLSSLQARQQRIMLFMMRQREDASRHIHNGHQSLRAAQAYLTAESLS